MGGVSGGAAGGGASGWRVCTGGGGEGTCVWTGTAPQGGMARRVLYLWEALINRGDDESFFLTLCLIANVYPKGIAAP